MTHFPPSTPAPLSAGVRPHRGEMILVLGILSLVISGCGVGLILGIVAWVMGNEDLRAMASGRMDPAGHSPTKAGRICGMIGVALSVLAVVVGVLYFVLIGALLASGGRGP
jgi:hypothetical protein